MNVGVVQTGIGTTASMLSMLAHLGIEAEVTSDADGLDRFSHLVLPGVGHYSEGARLLSAGGWRGPIATFATSGRPLLGVCLGMQLLGEGSDEGDGEGLGLLPFRLSRLPAAPGTPVPHMGWNTVRPVDDADPRAAAILAEGADSGSDARYYFVHSFAAPADSVVAVATTDYARPFASVVGRDNVVGVQFHPEKSHRFGMALLRRFAELG